MPAFGALNHLLDYLTCLQGTHGHRFVSSATFERDTNRSGCHEMAGNILQPNDLKMLLML
jgi:hypothetical protein